MNPSINKFPSTKSLPIWGDLEGYLDHLGSSSWITDQYGYPIQYLHYLPFGETWVDQRASSWNSRYTFSGKEKDEETGYSYFGARYYSPDLSIWLSVDPLAHVSPHQSPYVYCSNNPITRIDPDGRFDTRAEARQYRRENNTRGTIKKNSSGEFSINNKREGVSYYKDRNLANHQGVIGMGKDGVIKATMVSTESPTKSKSSDMAGVQISANGFILVGGGIYITVGHVKGEGLFASLGIRFDAGADESFSIGIISGNYHGDGQPSSSQLESESVYANGGALLYNYTYTRDAIINPMWITHTHGVSIVTKTGIGGSTGFSITLPPLKFK